MMHQEENTAVDRVADKEAVITEVVSVRATAGGRAADNRHIDLAGRKILGRQNSLAKTA